MIGKLLSSVSSALDFNSATLSGCMDIIVVKQTDGTMRSTPFHLRFGKVKALRTGDRIIRIRVNGELIDGVVMKLGSAGVGFFVEEVDGKDVIEMGFDTSPLTSPVTSPVNSPAVSAAQFPSIDEVETIALEAPEKSSQAGEASTKPSSESYTPEKVRTIPDIVSQDNSPRCGEDWQWEWGSMPAKSKDKKPSPQEEAVGPEAPALVIEKDAGTEKSGSVKSTESEKGADAADNERSPDKDVLLPVKLQEKLEEVAAEDGESLNAKLEAARMPRIEASLAGLKIQGRPDTRESDYELFKKELIVFGDIQTNPNLWFDERLVIIVDGQPPFHKGKAILPLLASWSVFRRAPPVTPPTLEIPDTTQRSRWAQWFSSSNTPTSPAAGQAVRPAVPASPRSPSEADTECEENRRRVYRKSLKPSSDQLKKLGLKYGCNSITFSIVGSLGTEQVVNANVYLWPTNARIIVSDIDGTITRSDVLGQVMPVLGRDWSHNGVTSLFTKIRNNGYFFLYLTARAIGQADQTRSYLQNLKQMDGTVDALPDGPVILSPDRLLSSFRREVIDKIPYEFKIVALRDVRSLFPNSHNCFYAGFGNRPTDQRAYVHVGIPEWKVFIINHQGDVSTCNLAYTNTYNGIRELADEMFPLIDEDDTGVEDQYNSFQFWRAPMEVEEDDLADYMAEEDDP